jgi:hypothetical protein
MKKSVKRKSKWKQSQTSPKTRQQLKLSLICFFILLLLVIGGLLTRWWSSFSKPSIKTPTPIQAPAWDGKTTFNVLFQMDDVYLMSYHPMTQDVTILKLPADMNLSVVEGYDTWPVRSIYKLGESEQKGKGAQLLQLTVQNNFGVPVDGVVIVTGAQKSEGLDELLRELKYNPFTSWSFLHNQIATISDYQLSQLIWGMWDVRADKIELTDLGPSNITQSILLGDGSRALGLDRVRLDALLQKEFEDKKLSFEGLTVAVFNATDHPGLAEKGSRIVANMGGRVTITSTFKSHAQKSVVLGQDSYTKSRLSEIFSPQFFGLPNDKMVIEQSRITDVDQYNRADVILILGEDAFGKF